MSWAGQLPVLDLTVDPLDPKVHAKAGARPLPVLHAAQPAYVIYTSGSTGQPKGVVVTHGALANYVQGVLARLALPEDVESMAMVSTVGADLGHTVLFGALCSGRTLHLIGAERAFDPDRFAAYMRQHRIDVLKIVPSHLQGLLSAARPEEVLPGHTLILGGEASSWPLLDHIGALRPQCRVINHYGPTETTVGVFTQAAAAASRSAGTVPIGTALPNVMGFVLDADLNATPPHVPGELYIGGAALAQGYQHASDLTAERFVASPFDEGERLYRTGDRVRMLKDGAVEFLGRTDDQVKVRGYRVELREITHALKAQPGVHATEVIARSTADGRMQLHAYVVPEAGAPLDPQVLQNQLSTLLPEYMVPSAIVVLEKLPLTSNGKVDRKALPEPGRSADRYEAPQGVIEETLGNIWAELLGVERVGRHDNFFQLGGDSMLALRFIARAQRCSIAIALDELFQHQTLNALALECARSTSVAREPTILAPIPSADRSGSLQLSPAQLRQWFLWNLDRHSAAYHTGSALLLSGPLDIDALRSAFTELVCRHESLRTVFRSTAAGSVEQVIRDTSEFDLLQLDLTGKSRDIVETRLTEEVQRVASTAFELTTGPLLRVGLLKASDQEHVLVVVMHHIASDGWSMQVLVEDLVELYGARVQGRAARLKALPIQYADYAAWQREWLTAGAQQRQLAYWREQLGDEHPVLQLPTDHPRAAQPKYQAASYNFELPAVLAEGLHRRAREHRGTVFMVLLAGFAVLLHRYTGERDIRVGSTNANRNRPETQGIVGFFVNTQVLRAQIESRMSLSALLEQTRTAVVGAQEHQDLPFEQLVEALQPERSLSHPPLFQVMMNHQRRDFAGLAELPGLTVQSFGLGRQGAQFELTVNTVEHPDGRVSTSLNYAVELFEPQTIQRLAEHYVKALQAFVDEPQQRVSAIGLLSVVEQEQLRNWGVNAQHYPTSEPVHRLIERQARQTPGATALIFGEEQLSYAQLNRRANRLAHRLIAHGVAKETRVGLAVERSVEMVVGLLAVLKAGGAYVPLDPEYPRERLRYMVEDSGIILLLTQSAVRARAPIDSVLPVLDLDTLDVSGECDDDPAVELHPENLAYVIYTSGSTGRPKAAANRHGSLHNRLVWMQEAYGLNSEDAVLQKTPFSFDVSVWEFFWPLMQGARLVVAPPGAHREPARLVELIVQHRISTLHFVPSMLQAFLEHDGMEVCTGLRHIVCSGEALAVAAQAKVLERLSWAKLHNLYGPTEAAIDVTHWTCRDEERGTVPIGRPITATRTVVLDGALSAVAPGAAGELYLGGVGLARGYLNRGGLTADRFIADPYSEAGERLYRTGDWARWSRDGQLEYLGRSDHQVKVRGYRIELGEIEAQLRTQPQVQEAVIIVREGPGGPRLLGYVVGQEQAQLDNTRVREQLAKTLPDYMVPSAVVVLDRLPLNANGKVDRKALPEPDIGTDRYEVPQGEVEVTLARIWQEVLGIERVGRQDNFFALGGHSLLALTVVAKLRQKGFLAEASSLFQHPQLTAFAQAVTLTLQHGTVVPVNAIAAGCVSIQPDMLPLVELSAEEIRLIESTVPGGAPNIQDIYPLAPLQEGILYHHLLEPDADVYVTSHLLSFDSEERLRDFVSGFEQLIARHDILRTAVLWEGLREPVQVVYRTAALPLEWLPPESDSVQPTAEDRLWRDGAQGRRRIEVRQAPMVRARATPDIERGRWLLLLTSHHLIGDHATLDFIVKEIEMIRQGRKAELAEPVPFRDFIAQTRRGGARESHEAFFKALLGDVVDSTSPFGASNVRGNGGDIEEAVVPLNGDLSVRLRRIAQRYGVTAATVFHLAWASVVGRSAGERGRRLRYGRVRSHAGGRRGG